MDLFVAIDNDIQKSVVKQHTKKTKSGKLAIVKQHTNKVVKKNKVKNPWIEKYGKYQLNGYPTPDIKDVQVNLKGDIHSHAVLTWYDPKLGIKKHVYTKEFMKRNTEMKWKRVSKVDKKLVDKIKVKTKNIYKNSNEKLKTREISAVINIIANTGLRVGTYQLFRRTGNRGVTTLAPNNVTVKGDVVSFNFTGKSFQDNKAQIKDKELAKFITTLKTKRKNSEFLFDTEYKQIMKFFKWRDKLGVGGDFNIKDLRTYVATDVAKKVLFESKLDISGLNNQKKIKKAIKNHINNMGSIVADKLNNTRTIALNSYIHPNLQKAWLNQLDVDPKLKEGFLKKANEDELTLDDIIAMYPAVDTDYNLDEDDEELCDEYPFIDWLEETEEEINKGINNMYHYIDIEKSVVKQHTKVSDKGTMSVVKQHQRNIAKKTLNMPDAMVGVMGGMNKKEAKEFLDEEKKEKILYKLDKVGSTYQMKIKSKFGATSFNLGTDKFKAKEDFHRLQRLIKKDNPQSISEITRILFDYDSDEYEIQRQKEYERTNKSQEDELGHYIDIEKANVKAHARVTKTGKMSQVKQYTDKRRSAQPKMQSNKQSMQQGQQQGQQEPGMEEPHPAQKLQKKIKHIDFMMKEYPNIIDKNKALQLKKKIKERIRNVEDLTDVDDLLNEGIAKEGDSESKQKKEKKIYNPGEAHPHEQQDYAEASDKRKEEQQKEQERIRAKNKKNERAKKK